MVYPCRYGHSATLVEMHPPKIMIYGGLNGSNTFEFESPISAGPSLLDQDIMERSSMISRRRQGRRNTTIEEPDDSIYFLSLQSDRWIWNKPLIHGTAGDKPAGRCEHSACKTSTNEITIFGGMTYSSTNSTIYHCLLRLG